MYVYVYASRCTNGVFVFNDLLVKINCTSDNEQLNNTKTNKKQKTEQLNTVIKSFLKITYALY